MTDATRGPIMTIKEITYLALLLIAGLIFNRCAFEGDATELTRAGKRKSAAVSIARQSEATAKSLEKKIDRLGQQIDEFGERMGELDERVGEEFEDLGDELSEGTDKIGEQVGESTAEGVSNDLGAEAEPGGKKTSLVHYLS